jgi:hypothetical protein
LAVLENRAEEKAGGQTRLSANSVEKAGTGHYMKGEMGKLLKKL